jgi:hypothetical protein
MNRLARNALVLLGFVFVCLQIEANGQRQDPATGPVLSDTAASARIGLDYFPLQVGNEWIYGDGATTISVQVLGETVESNRIKYFDVSGYLPGDQAAVRKLRRGLPGQVLEYNPGGEDFLWYRFGLFRGAWQFETAGEVPCVTGSRVSIGSFGEVVEVPAGISAHTLRLDFLSPCMDAGISREYFAPGVGLVQRVMNTIAGPRTFRLLSARVGPNVWPPALYGVEVATDRPVYFNNLMPPIIAPWPTMHARLVVRNQTDTPVEFTYPTSQRFDFIVRDAQGKEVLRWSDGKAFAMVVGRETLVRGWRSYPADIVLRTRDGKLLPSGSYTLLGYLATKGSESGLFGMAGIVTLEIRDLH